LAYYPTGLKAIYNPALCELGFNGF